jgi:hypothetical protein
MLGRLSRGTAELGDASAREAASEDMFFWQLTYRLDDREPLGRSKV